MSDTIAEKTCTGNIGLERNELKVVLRALRQHYSFLTEVSTELSGKAECMTAFSHMAKERARCHALIVKFREL